VGFLEMFSPGFDATTFGSSFYVHQQQFISDPACTIQMSNK